MINNIPRKEAEPEIINRNRLYVLDFEKILRIFSYDFELRNWGMSQFDKIKMKMSKRAEIDFVEVKSRFNYGVLVEGGKLYELDSPKDLDKFKMGIELEK